MTPLPKRKHSTRRKGKRRAALSLRLPSLLACPNCRSLRLPHHACEYCGQYNGKEAVPVKTKKKKS